MRSKFLGSLLICIGAVVVSATLARGGDTVPQVVRLRVPSDRVDGIFPVGTELRGLPRDEFEALVDAASAGVRRSEARPEGSRLLRARHDVRLEGDRLVGRTEVGFEPGGLVPLDPWSPAIGDLDPAEGRLMSGADERLVLKPAKKEATSARLSWVQASDLGSNGRTFTIGLPSAASSRLTLDLPEGVVPEIAGSIRQGPTPGASPERRAWRLDLAPGPWRLRLRWPRSAGEPADPVWIRGTTQIDASQVPARWSLSAEVDPGTAGPRRIGLRLAPGLELLEVSGPGVASFRKEADGGETIVMIRLADSVVGSTPITVRALSAGPTEGVPWSIPGFTPIGAVFAGGRTLVRLGTGQVVVASQEGVSRQVDPTAAEREFGGSRTGLLLAFESAAAGTPAILSVRRPSADARAEVRGAVTLGSRGSRSLEARLTWNLDRGQIVYLSADLPPGWRPESARIRDQSEVTAWHLESRPGGGTRVVVRPASSNIGRGPIVLDLTSTSRVPAEPQTLELPRVTPVGVRVIEEVWSLRSEPGVSISPNRARGLAWLDPTTLDRVGLTASPAASPPTIMAWRWTAADGQASLDLGRDATSSGIDAWTIARFRGDRLQLDYYLVLAGAGADSAGSVVVFPAKGLEFPARWGVLGQAGRTVEAVSIPEAECQTLGVPRSLAAWRLGVTRAEGERLVLHARVEQSWMGSGSPPLLKVFGSNSRGGTLLIASDRDHGLTCDASGLTPLDPDWAAASFRDSIGEFALASQLMDRPVLAFSYSGATPPPTIQTTWLPPAAKGGIVEEARLSSIPTAQGFTLHRLDLRIVAGPDRKIEVRLPTGMTIDRAEIDGKPTSALSVGGVLRFSLPEPIPSQPMSKLGLNYISRGNDGPGVVRADRPALSLPCLAFSWGIELAPGYLIDHVSGGLVGPGLSNSESNVAQRPRSTLDERVRRFSPEGLTLGGWLARLDGGGAAHRC